MAIALRWTAFAISALVAMLAAWLFILLARADGWSALDTVRLVLSTMCVFWLTWGTMGGIVGLLPLRRATPPIAGNGTTRTAILMPIYHEEPASTFARVAAMSARLTNLKAHERIDIFILSDSQSLDAAAREALWFERLLTDCAGRQQIFYRRRSNNTGRKAGNIEDFIRRSGGAYDYALVLDADSLMDARAIVRMIDRMDASPRLGLLQTLPVIVQAQSLFGRAMQFSAAFYTPTFARGTALMQGREGPYWGHNAIFRVEAFARSCGLPKLGGRPPFGGQILSHDYVEAALLTRAGYEVQLDPTIGGSFEEGPENIVDFAKRDQRWCQGNLQHSRVLLAPDLRVWNRITLLQGIFNYLMPPIWLVLLVVSIASADMARSGGVGGAPDWAGWVLIGFVVGILVLPKLLIGVVHVLRGPVRRIDQRVLLLASIVAEIVLSTVTAPVVLMFQVRAVLRVFFGFDGGWPPSHRADGQLSVTQAWAGSWWITCCGGTGLALVLAVAPGLAAWSLPVTLPMILAPLIIAGTSLPVASLHRLWQVRSERHPSAVLREWRTIHEVWTRQQPDLEREFSNAEAVDVLG